MIVTSMDTWDHGQLLLWNENISNQKYAENYDLGDKIIRKGIGGRCEDVKLHEESDTNKYGSNLKERQ